MDEQQHKNKHRDRDRKDRGSRDREQRKFPRSEVELRGSFTSALGKHLDQILISQKESYNEYIDAIKKYVAGKYRGWSASQLRNVFTQVKTMKEYSELCLVRPKLAYASGRTDSSELKELLLLLDDVIKKVNSNDQLREFKSFFESIIAYHKYYGGKE